MTQYAKVDTTETVLYPTTMAFAPVGSHFLLSPPNPPRPPRPLPRPPLLLLPRPRPRPGPAPFLGGGASPVVANVPALRAAQPDCLGSSSGASGVSDPGVCSRQALDDSRTRK